MRCYQALRRKYLGFVASAKMFMWVPDENVSASAGGKRKQDHNLLFETRAKGWMVAERAL